MDLHALGYNDWFASRAASLLQEGHSVARVMTVDRGAFQICGESGETLAELSGKFRFDAESGPDMPCVGDWVCVEHQSPTLAIIHAILPRKTTLRRKSPGKAVKFQLMATNLETAFVVQSCYYDFNIRRLERYLAALSEDDIEPIVILSKTDLVSAEDLAVMTTQVRDAGITAQIVPISNTTGEGLDTLGSFLAPGKTFCLLGSSGVGKTTLVNRFSGRDALETQPVKDSGEGVHTTSRRQLLVLGNGAILIDTPGVREFGLLGASDGVEVSFSDIQELSLTCRFSNCTHLQEPGCAVLAAIETGDLAEDRYHSYQKLTKETKHNDRSALEQRRKDKTLGRLIKTVKKNRKR